MGRLIPSQLQDHLRQDSTTTTLLIRIDPVPEGVDSFGACMTNRDFVYNDGAGPLMYYGYVGMVPSTLLTTGSLSIDNADFQSLLPEYEFPITEEDIQAGVYDEARYTLYLVNYEDLTTANHVVVGYGTLGRMRTLDGLSFWEELRGLSQKLKQTVCARDSLTCRARLGSQPIGTGGGAYEEREYCGIDLSGYWETGIVQAPGVEPHYGFTTTDPLTIPSGGSETNFFAPGMVLWTSGRNTGRETEIESNGESSISLAFRTAFAIQPGDEFMYRRDCNKQARDEEKGCPSHWGNEWNERVRAEPDIPIGDAIVNAIPGGTTSPVQGGVSEEAEV